MTTVHLSPNLNPSELHLADQGDGYDPLREVLRRAVEQASGGKGKERHASGEPFVEQKIVKLAEWTGGAAFDIGQACKKAIESQRMPPDRAVAELLGAINYLAAAVIVREREARAGRSVL